MLRSLVLLALLVAGRPAHALFDVEGLDPAFCNQPTVRQTVVYIDDMAMITGQTEWALSLDTKLRATLTPGERVTVVRLSPANGQSREYWSGCWPAFTAEQRAKIQAEHYIFSASPLDKLGDQQKYFLQGFGGALTRIYQSAQRDAGSVRFGADHAPPKQILRALVSDEGRFTNTHSTIRAVIFSDMAENSDLGSVFQPLPLPPVSYGQKLGSYLRGGVFYAFGVGADVEGAPDFTQGARRFWSAALKSMSATTAGMGSDLNIPNTLPTRAYVRAITMPFDGQELDGKLSLLTGEDGTLVDSWLGISRLGTAALTGSFVCQASGACRLDSATTSGIVTNAPSESLMMSGPEGGLAGQIGVKGQDLTFPIKTLPAGN